METEQQLLNAIHNGERAALQRLYDRYSRYAMAIGLRYIPEREEVRDVIQDSFVKILTNIHQFEYRGEGSLKSWVSKIVVNKAIDYLRVQQRISFVSNVPDLVDEESPDLKEIPPDILTVMIGRLPDNYRLVLYLFVFEQRSHREIAQQLGIKEKTSASLFFRAKQMLSKMVKEYVKQQEI